MSFQFEDGKIIGLLGPNGAGKTTTISIISGLLKPDSGKVYVLNKDTEKDIAFIKKHIGVVPQQIALFENLSCLENLIYFGKLQNIPTEQLNKSIEEFLHIFGLEQHAYKQVKHFSGGMKRRANIIASLLHSPSLLILDEPTSGVDVHSRNVILKFLKDYQQKGNSIIYTSHLLEEAEAICEEVLIIDHGKKIVQGNPFELNKIHQVDNLETLFIKLTGTELRD
ncbi:MAG: ABC transporter [Bacteroidetes bacterium OLB11]|nr:MAG: ABC transporter [Bacteroidetes bacterium OLB11]